MKGTPVNKIPNAPMERLSGFVHFVTKFRPFWLTSLYGKDICRGAAMNRCLLVLAILLFSALAPARDKTENWLQVRTPHFVIVTNGSEKQGRRVADQFERMRAVF